MKSKTAAESEFQTAFTPATAPNAPIKLGSKEYDDDLWDSPTVRTLKRAIAGWEVPAPAARTTPLSKVLKADDPRLTPTLNLPGREQWRTELARLVASAGAVKDKPTAYFLAGPMGVGKVAIAKRFYEQGVLPSQLVKADADYLHALVPEQSQLDALGDGRANDVVHEEASQVGKAAYALALQEKRDVVYNSMLDSPESLGRMQKAKEAGFKRLVFAIVSPLDVARARAGANGALFDDGVLVKAHAKFASVFDDVVKNADELVLLLNDGFKLDVLAQAKAGQLTVKDEKKYSQFRAMKDLA